MKEQLMLQIAMEQLNLVILTMFEEWEALGNEPTKTHPRNDSPVLFLLVGDFAKAHLVDAPELVLRHVLRVRAERSEDV